jgi:drug/metabolite transporter (DMT)-like permease
MIYLLLSVFSSSLIFVLFKLFPTFRIDTFQAIVFNYFTAFFLGIFLYGNTWKSVFLYAGNWPYFACCCALLFISLFILMGISSQKNGVSSTSIAVKMSMAISLIIIIIAYNESLSVFKIAGILLAFIGVFLVTYEKQKERKETSFLWILLVLFLGSGLLDFLLNYVQKYELNQLTPSLFSAIGFGIAGLIGLIILSFLFVKKQRVFSLRNIVAGIVLGVPNYFSIYLLIVSYQSTGWNDSTVLAVNNVLVVILAAFIGFIVFKEKVNKQKILGFVTAVVAIILLFIANK